MSRRRLHLPPGELGTAQPGERVRLAGERAHYLGRVLRLEPGQRLLLFDGAGREQEAELVETAAGWVEVRLGPVVETPAPEEPPLTLFLGLTKADAPDRVIRAVTELGLERIVPVATRRSVVTLTGDRALQRVVRWRRIAAEAARQCGRTRIPAVDELISLPRAVETVAGLPGAARLVMHEEERAHPLRAALAGPPPTVAALIGPEGGLAPDEVALAVQQGWTPVGLGRSILRAETAAVAVATLVGQAYGLLG